METKISALSDNIVEGSIKDFDDDSIIIGKELAALARYLQGRSLKVLSAETRLTPLGGVPRSRTFEVKAMFSSGLYEYDKTWVYVPIGAAQRLMGVGDVASAIEVKIDDIYQSKAIGQKIINNVGGNSRVHRLDDDESIDLSGSESRDDS